MSDVLPISPTITQAYLKCVAYGALSRVWVPMGEWKPYFATGHSLHKAIELLLQRKTEEEAIEAAIAVLAEEYQEQDEWPLDALEALIVKGIKAMLKKDAGFRFILDNETILGIEEQVGKEGAKPGEPEDATLDLISKRGEEIIITDHKSHLKLEAKWIQRNLQDADVDHQMWDYAWRYQQKTGLIVKKTRRHMVILSPAAKSLIHEVELKQDILVAWRKGIEKEWEYIHTFDNVPIQDVPMRLTSCIGRYGRCPMYTACHTANRDPNKMTVLYRKRSA